MVWWKSSIDQNHEAAFKVSTEKRANPQIPGKERQSLAARARFEVARLAFM